MPGSLVLLAVITITPGFYFPPFFDGISGWAVTIEKDTPLYFHGYKLIRDDGEEAWYSNAFVSPVTQNGRFMSVLRRKLKAEVRYEFLAKNYERIYSDLAKGKDPHQKILGRWAYPTHNLSKYSPVYKEFPPESIEKIVYVSVLKKRDGTPAKVTLYEEYDVDTGHINVLQEY